MLTIKGKITQVLGDKSGISKAGKPWKIRSYLLETSEQFSKKIAFDVFGDENISKFNIQPGQELAIDIEIDSHEFKGRWYPSVRAIGVKDPF